MNRLPYWFLQTIPDTNTLNIKHLLSEFAVNTVCQEARCPNLSHCFKELKLTFMILGDTCTRNCRFCAVMKHKHKKAHPLDEKEPFRIARIINKLGLNYVVITSVTRDDLADGGAAIFAKTIELIRDINRNIKVEVLIPDFCGNILSLNCVLEANPDVIAHNIETVRRLHPDLRSMSDYRLSLDVLKNIKELKPDLISKSSLMLGLGETEQEVIETMQDLRAHQCDSLTLGQYLAPSIGHYPVREFISIEQFQRYQEIGIALGFKAVLSGPLVRSSFGAEDLFAGVRLCMI